MRGCVNDVGIPWEAIEAACPLDVLVALDVSGPQALRIAACAMAAGSRVERVVTRHGRCTSARRERLTIRLADVPDVLRGLAATASMFFAAGRVRDGEEMLATAKLVESYARVPL